MMHPPCPGASLRYCLRPMKSLRRRENTLGVLSLRAARGNGSFSVPNKMTTQQLTSLPLPTETFMQMRKNSQCVNSKYTLVQKVHLWGCWNSCRSTLEVVLPQFGVSDVGNMVERPTDGLVLILAPGVFFRLSVPGLLSKLWRLRDTWREL